MKKIFFYIIFILLFSGFIPSKDYLQSKNNNYIKEIPFTFKYGVPIINVNIDGVKYRFLFDTGMPTALSENLTKKFNLKSIRSVRGKDVNHNSKQENYVIVEEIEIGGISFKNVEALSANLSSSFEIGCLNIDGVFGNNIIKNAIWEIDYKNKKIKFTDKIDNLQIPENAKSIKFKTNKKRGYFSPNINIKINNKKQKRVKFDTGSNGGFKMPLNLFFEISNSNKSIEYYGQASAALYGKGSNKKYIDSKIKFIKMGDVELKDQIVTFSSQYPLIGNKLFQDYRVILDYPKNEIYMIKQTGYHDSILENFGFQTCVIDGKSIVTIIYKGSDAEKKGIKLGDEISEINNIDQKRLISDKPCDFMLNNSLKTLEKAKIIRIRNNKEKLIELEKNVFIE